MTAHDCARIEELISARMDGATSPEEDARIERHLRDCADCRATALAFSHVDREVSAYLRATPVPAIARPWREARRTPLFAQGLLTRWRPATLALTTILVLVVASVLAFGAFQGKTRPAQQTSAPQSAYTTSGGAAPSTAPSTAASAAPTATNPVVRSAAPALAPAAPSAAPSSAPAVGARATAASGGSTPTASSAPAASSAPGGAASSAASGTPSSVPMIGAGSALNPINPVQQLRLASATMLVICRPDCAASPQGATTLTEVVALLDTPLKRVSPATPTATIGAAATVLRFTLADGPQVELRYSPDSGQLGLPDGTLLLAPSTLREVLSSPVRQP